MNDQMMRVISSPSSSTTGFLTLFLAMGSWWWWARRCYRGGVIFSQAMAATAHPPRQGDTWQTHEVFNQTPPLVDVDVFSSNLPLVEALQREGGGWAAERAAALGRFVGKAGGPQELWGRQANENKPVLHTHDRYGHRI